MHSYDADTFSFGDGCHGKNGYMRWLSNFRHCSGESTTLERRGKKPEFLRSVEQQQYDAVKVREMKADKHRNNKMLPTHSVKREIFLGSS